MKLLVPLILASGICASAAEAPLWIRDTKISPDGKTIAFCYKGDIYTVPSGGGRATRLTASDSYEQQPVWSPDSRSIAYASDAYGSFDVFIMDTGTLQPRRLTFNSGSEIPQSFTPDGNRIVFDANIQDPSSSALFPRAVMDEVYSVPVEGGRIRQILPTPARSIHYSPDGKFFLYQDVKGLEDEFRKHHVSSVTRDIWLYDTAGGRHKNLTCRPGEDLDPVLGPDGKSVYFISEPANTPDGHPSPEGWGTSLNVYCFDLEAADGSTTPPLRRISSFTRHPVRFLSMAGDLLCYTWNGEIYTQTAGKDPEKVKVEITDFSQNVPELKTDSSGSFDAAVSPDGKQIAYIKHSDVFVTSVDYQTTKRITCTACAESGVVFGPDSRSIVYASDRSGVCQLYRASIVRKEDPDFANATLIKEEIILPCPGVDRRRPSFSPDGKTLAFVQDRRCLMTGDIDSGKIKRITDGSSWVSSSDSFTYNWSPDGRWFTLEYVPNNHAPYSDIGLVSAKGGEITNITGSGYISANPRFTADGNAILFISDRYGMRSHASWGSKDDIFLCFLNRDAYDRYRLSKEDYELKKESEKSGKDKDADSKKAKTEKIKVELEGIQDRIVRLSPYSSSISDAIITKDGETLYFVASFDGSYDLWKMNLRKKDPKTVSKAVSSGFFDCSADFKSIFFLGNSFRKLESDSFKNIPCQAQLKIDHAAEREYMFDYVCREEAERFYDASLHGVDWKGLCAEYRRFLPHISNNWDFAEMLSELLGELNVSHTGCFYSPSSNVEATGKLGLLFDLEYEGEGLRVSEVIKDGPCDRDDLKIKAGDIILKIDGQSLEEGSDKLLSGKIGRKTLLSVKGKGEMVVIPISRSSNNELLYRRWVRQRAADVEKWSSGRLGYVHIRSMNDASYRDIYSDILGKYNKCEGIVIDVRFNGGGRLHEDIEILFSGEKYLTQTVRGREYCDMPSRRWNKPSIMVTCEADYSNAHGTPWVYKHRNIGKIVGAPVPGTMTSVNWVKLLDGSLTFGIPVVGYLTSEGYYLENHQLEPDIKVLNDPVAISSGEDAQLRRATEELLNGK